jgi:hypothetical protein
VNELLSALKADLLDRRLRPLVVLAALALVAALSYVVLGGSSPATPSALVAPPTHGSPGIAVTQSTGRQGLPVAETTNGGADQHRGISHNPFTPLVKIARPTVSAPAAAASAAAAPAAGSSPAGSTTGTGSSPRISGGSSPASPVAPSAPATPPKPTTPAKPTTIYHVAAMFGPITPGAAPETALLTPYESLNLLTPLPTAVQPLIVFRGVTSAGKSATFTIVGEAILHGSGACLPRASQCQAIDLKPGAFEQLEYLAPTGTVAYELRVVSIVSNKASGASAKTLLRGESKPGLEVLRRTGLLAVPDLHYSAQVGVLAFAAHPAFAARARAATSRRRHSR